MQRPHPEVVRFGVFELDLRARELRKQGRRVALQDKPFELLAMLVETPGVVVSRADLQQRLWPADTFVVFADNLNVAVRKVREALGDAADSSRFVETVPRRGYRFIAPVDRVAPAESTAGVAVQATRPTRDHWVRWAAPLVAASAIVTVAASQFATERRRREPVGRFEHLLSEDQQFTGTRHHVVAISHDGTAVVFVANKRLYLRPLDQRAAEPIPGTDEDPIEPMFSPDDRSIAYFTPPGSGSPGSLRIIALTGGQSRKLCDVSEEPTGASWSHGGIVFAVRRTILFVKESGGVAKTIVSTNSADVGRFAQPHLIDGDRVLFTQRPPTHTFDGTAEIVVQTIGREDRRTLVQGMDGRLLADGRLAYHRGDAVYTVRLDPTRTRVIGDPLLVQERVRTFRTHAVGHFAVADNGTFVYLPGISVSSQRRLVRVDAHGVETPIDAPARAYVYVRVSPDGRKLAMDSRDAEHDIWIWEDGKTTQLTTGNEEDRAPLWTPDGNVIFTKQTVTGKVRYDLFLADLTHPASPKRLTFTDSITYASDVAPGGEAVIAWTNLLGTGGVDLVRQPVSGGPAHPLAQLPGVERNGVVSPSGEWLAYEWVTPNQQPQVCLQRLPDPAHARWCISLKVGTAPVWSRDGRSLFYRSATDLISVSVDAGPPVEWPQKPLFPVRGYYSSTARNYDVAPDGRFVFIKLPPADPKDQRRFVVSNLLGR